MPLSTNTNGELKKKDIEVIDIAAKYSQFRSVAVNEILSRRSGFLSRWALLIFLSVLLLLLSITWFIQYPDIVEARAKLTSVNAPKPVVCKKDGKLILLTIKEDDFVERGTIIGCMENTSDFDQVRALSESIDSMVQMCSNMKDSSFPQLTIKHFEHLGDLQLPYQTFLHALIDFNDYARGGFYEKKKLILANNLSNMVRVRQLLAERKISQQEDVELAEKTFKMNEILKKDKVISELEYRNEKSKLLMKQLTIPQINEAIIANETERNNLQKEIQELNSTIRQQAQIFKQALNTLKSAIDEWKDKNLLVAPISGKAGFAGFIQKNQQLKAGQVVCFINPGNSEIFAETYIPQANFGKVKKGEKVLLQLSSYPSQEFGAIPGTLEFISPIPSDSGYLAKIILPNGLVTNYNKKLHYQEGLTATAQIITQNMRMINRLIYSVRKEVER